MKSLKKNFDMSKIIIAYEPVWSIGTNKIPKKNELIKIIKFIKNNFKNIILTKKTPKVLYGGSVNSKNISLFSTISEIDGFLIGGASQSSKKFIYIVKITINSFYGKHCFRSKYNFSYSFSRNNTFTKI